MKNKEIDIFIEEMQLIGDEWTPEQVENVYGKKTLEEALVDRKSVLGTFFGCVEKVLNR